MSVPGEIEAYIASLPEPKRADWTISVNVGESGECLGLVLRKPDLRPITPKDARDLYKLLKLPEPTYADLADMGVEAWR